MNDAHPDEGFAESLVHVRTLQLAWDELLLPDKNQEAVGSIFSMIVQLRPSLQKATMLTWAKSIDFHDSQVPLRIFTILKCSWSQLHLKDSILVPFRIFLLKILKLDTKPQIEALQLDLHAALQLISTPLSPEVLPSDVKVYSKSLLLIYTMYPTLQNAHHDPDLVITAIRQLCAYQDFTGAIRLAETLKDHVLPEHIPEITKTLLSAGAWEPLKSYLLDLPRDSHQELVLKTIEKLMSIGEKTPLAVAVDVATHHRLGKDIRFEVQELLAKKKISAIVKSYKWQVAMKYCERNEQRKVFLFEFLLAEGLFHEAALARTQLNMQNIVPPVDQKSLDAQKGKNQLDYLQFPAAAVPILLVDSVATVWAAARLLQVAGDTRVFLDPATLPESHRVIGLDAEWGGDHRKYRYPAEESASILQVASVAGVCIFDMFRLKANREAARLANQLLSLLFSSAAIIKLGFAFGDADIKMLSKVHPLFNFTATVRSLIEMTSLQLKGIAAPFPCAGFSGSLGALCHAWLKKPLNKSECISNWEKRPLTTSQLHYAALDAHCLLAILECKLLAYSKIDVNRLHTLPLYLSLEEIDEVAKLPAVDVSSSTERGLAFLSLHTQDINAKKGEGTETASIPSEPSAFQKTAISRPRVAPAYKKWVSKVNKASYSTLTVLRTIHVRCIWRRPFVTVASAALKLIRVL